MCHTMSWISVTAALILHFECYWCCYHCLRYYYYYYHHHHYPTTTPNVAIETTCTGTAARTTTTTTTTTITATPTALLLQVSAPLRILFTLQPHYFQRCVGLSPLLLLKLPELFWT